MPSAPLTYHTPYQQDISQISKGRRADATSVLLLQAQQWMERFYTQNYRYDQDLGGTPVTDNPVTNASPFGAFGLTQAPIQGNTKYYNITIASVTERTFTLNAAPIAGSAQAGDACGTLTLTNTGVQGVTGGTKSADECWR